MDSPQHPKGKQTVAAIALSTAVWTLSVVPVALVLVAWGAPWWAATLGGFILGEFAGAFIVWWFLESVVGIDSWLLTALGAGVGFVIWNGLYLLGVTAVSALCGIQVRPPSLLRRKRTTRLNRR